MSSPLAKPGFLRAWPPAPIAALLQLIGLAGMLVLLAAFGGLGLSLDLAVLAAGGIAGLLSRRIGQPAWWQLINLVFLPALWFASQVEIAPHWYLAAFMLLALTSFGALVSRVPLYLSSRQAMAAIAAEVPADRPARVLDLGCGLGGVLAHLARVRPRAELYGVDAAPLPWLISRIRLGKRARIRLGSLWDENLADYDVVYAYLSPAPMPKLWQKVRAEMRPGSLFISNSFAVPCIEPQRVIALDDFNRARLLLWRT